MDAAASAEEAQRLLFDIRVGPQPARKFYTDMGAMVLKYVVESAADLSFWEYLQNEHPPPARHGSDVCRGAAGIARRNGQLQLRAAHCKRRLLAGHRLPARHGARPEGAACSTPLSPPPADTRDCSQR